MVTAGPPAPPGRPTPRITTLPGGQPPARSGESPADSPADSPAGSPADSPTTPTSSDDGRTSDAVESAVPSAFARLTAGGSYRIPAAVVDSESADDADWHNSDPRAGEAFGAGATPLDRALNRNKSVHARSRTTTDARMALRMLCNDDDTPVDVATLRAYPWHQISVEMAQDFRREVYRRYDNQGTRNRKICFLRTIARECYKLDLISAPRREHLLDELYTVFPGRSARRHRIETEEFGKLMDACQSTGTDFMRARNSAIVALFYTTGLRVNELVSIDLAHWDRRDDSIHLPHTKNTDPHTVFLHPAANLLLQEWLEVRGSSPGKLFTGQHRPPGSALHPATVRDMLASRCRTAGIEYFPTHDFRRTFATTMLRQYDAALVSKLLNHRKLASTLIYDMSTDDEMRDAVGSIHLTTRRIGGAA